MGTHRERRTIPSMTNDERRHVIFENCFNFRDIGGYETVDGRSVRWGAVFRSDSPQRMSDADVDLALELGLRTVIDLRTSVEIDKEGTFPRRDHIIFRHAPFFEEDQRPFFPPGDDGVPVAVPGEGYASIAVTAMAATADAFREIAEGDHAVMFHCAAGKDRTGMLAALLLSTLGVADNTIIADYELSERSLAPLTAWADVNDAVLAGELALIPLTAWSPAPSMKGFLTIIRERHGSLDGYLRDAGVDGDVLEALRGRLLEG